MTVYDSAGAMVYFCDFGFRGTGSCEVPIAPTASGLFDVAIAPNLPASSYTYLLDTAPATAGGTPRLGCFVSTLAGGTSRLQPQCDLGVNPLVSGVVHSDLDVQHLWFHAHEGQLYTIRFDSTMAEATLHHPTATGFTSFDSEPLFRLPARNDIAEREEGRQAVTFVAPVTGWYRLRIRGKVPVDLEGLSGTYPSTFVVEFAATPVRVSDYPELLQWSVVPTGVPCI
jgi:hypothetical protein